MRVERVAEVDFCDVLLGARERHGTILGNVHGVDVHVRPTIAAEALVGAGQSVDLLTRPRRIVPKQEAVDVAAGETPRDAGYRDDGNQREARPERCTGDTSWDPPDRVHTPIARGVRLRCGILVDRRS